MQWLQSSHRLLLRLDPAYSGVMGSTLAAGLAGLSDGREQLVLTQIDQVLRHQIHRRHHDTFVLTALQQSAQSLAEFGQISFPVAIELLNRVSKVQLNTGARGALADLHVIATSNSEVKDRGIPNPDFDEQRVQAFYELFNEVGSSLLIAAVILGEIESIPLFQSATDLVGLSIFRVLLKDRGVDPDGVIQVESGFKILGRSTYESLLKQYQSGTANGLKQWIEFVLQAITFGAQTSLDLANQILNDER